jgi:hypothetical protein
MRYVTPLREGGSLPAVVEANDLGTYVLKVQGAGQVRKALIAEIVAGEIARCTHWSGPWHGSSVHVHLPARSFTAG